MGSMVEQSMKSRGDASARAIEGSSISWKTPLTCSGLGNTVMMVDFRCKMSVCDFDNDNGNIMSAGDDFELCQRIGFVFEIIRIHSLRCQLRSYMEKENTNSSLDVRNWRGIK